MEKSLDSKRWVEQYANQLFKFAVSRIGNSELAKDLVQDTFLSALKNADGFRGDISEKNWLYTILKNKIIDHYKSKARAITSSLNEQLEKMNDYFDEEGNWHSMAKPTHWLVNDLQNIETKEFYGILDSCKKKLNELQHMVFTMKFMDDMNSDNICKELNISSSNYWVLMHRAKLQMRACLEKNWFKK
ncbi:MAG TPA: sigma-70 family RNA polymerase sigma factor [Bacteroidia bacterium]